MKARRSVRRFRPEPPPRALVERLIAAAVTAPSATNQQPWRFLAVSRPDAIARIAASVREEVDRIAGHVEPALEPSFRAYGDFFTRFEGAPLVIVVLHRGLSLLSSMVDARLPEPLRARIAALERDSGLMGAAMALENLLLAAHDLGLGASGMTGPLVASDRIREILEVPARWEIAALAPVGYPDEVPPAPERKPVGAVLRWIE